MDLIIVGTGEFATIASQYFEEENKYNIIGFAVEKRYKNKESFMGKKVYDLEEIAVYFDPQNIVVFVAIVYQELNRARTRIYQMLKEMGYGFATYISPYSFVGKEVHVGENSFVFENNTLQYNVTIGNNVVIWSGNHIGHSSKIKDNCYIASHVCISGHTVIGKNSFLGVNSSVANDVTLPDDTVVAMGAAVNKSIEMEGCILAGVPAKPLKISAYERFDVNDQV